MLPHWEKKKEMGYHLNTERTKGTEKNKLTQIKVTWGKITFYFCFKRFLYSFIHFIFYYNTGIYVFIMTVFYIYDHI